MDIEQNKLLQQILKRMVVQVDSREKHNKHIISYFKHKGIKYEKTTLNYGDYTFYVPESKRLKIKRFEAKMVIERKGSPEELKTNLFTNDSNRLLAEMTRCHNDGSKMVFLVESSSSNLFDWIDRKNIDANELFNAILAFEKTEFRFQKDFVVEKLKMGSKIIELFKEYLEEYLKGEVSDG